MTQAADGQWVGDRGKWCQEWRQGDHSGAVIKGPTKRWYTGTPTT